MTNLRIGLGEDSHRTAEGGPLRLGGIDVPHDRHLLGHSDADVLLHAVTDALLGAAGLPDIGQLFPNTDEANRNRDSADMLRLAYDRVVAAGYEIVNLDCVVAAQRPKLSPHKEAITAASPRSSASARANQPEGQNRRRRRARRAGEETDRSADACADCARTNRL